LNGTSLESGQVRNEDAAAVSAFLATLWRGKVRIGMAAVAGGVLAFALTFLQPEIYSAQVTLLPQQESSKANLLSQVASFTGINVDTELSFEQLYKRIVTSDRLLDEVVDHIWTLNGSTMPIDLFEVFDEEGDADDPVARHKLKSHLRRAVITFSREERTGFMVLKVDMPGDPQLAADIANVLVDLLDAFNLEYRSRKAVEQRTFIQERLDETGTALEAASAALTEFVATNRNYRAAPALMQRFGDLEREVQAETTVWLELRRQLELAKIEESKQLTTIAILDRASPPIKPSSPLRKESALVGALLGLLAAVAAVVAVGFLAPRPRERSGETV